MLFPIGMSLRISDEDARKHQVKVFTLDVGSLVIDGWKSPSLTV